MNKLGKTRYVFASSYTCHGFHTFIPELINGLGKVYILKGPPGTGKSTFIRLLGELMSQKGYEVEFWVSSLDPITPDGVHIPELDSAIINGSLPTPIDPKYPGVREIVINLGEYWDQQRVDEQSNEIIALIDQTEIYRDQALHLLKEASIAKEEIRANNFSRLNMEKIEQCIKRLSMQIMERHPGEKHYFASNTTGEGLADYINELSEDCKCRYIFKGPSGSGKSTVIYALAQEAKQRGYFLEYYHSGLDEAYLGMVIIRDLQLALVESGDLEVSPRQGDVVVDMNKCLDDWENDMIEFKSNEAVRRFERLLLQAQEELGNAYQSHRIVKKAYSLAMDFERLEHKRQTITNEILNQD